MLSDSTYFETAKEILHIYHFLHSKKLTALVNKKLGTNVSSQTLSRYIIIYNDGSIRKKSKRVWEYVE